MLTCGAAALLFGGTRVGGAGQDVGVASASTRDADAGARQAAKLSDKANRALAKSHADDAVDYAEKAVALAPREAGYRAVPGQSYLTDGRFTSARQAFTDALALDSNNGKVSPSLSLSQPSKGDWTAAPATPDAQARTSAVEGKGVSVRVR